MRTFLIHRNFSKLKPNACREFRYQSADALNEAGAPAVWELLWVWGFGVGSSNWIRRCLAQKSEISANRLLLSRRVCLSMMWLHLFYTPFTSTVEVCPSHLRFCTRWFSTFVLLQLALICHKWRLAWELLHYLLRICSLEATYLLLSSFLFYMDHGRPSQTILWSNGFELKTKLCLLSAEHLRQVRQCFWSLFFSKNKD